MQYSVFFTTVLFAFGITVFFFWSCWNEFERLRKARKHPFKKNIFTLSRHEDNPILKPGSYDFEREAVMNPAAVHDGERTHLFYRALGSDGVSRIGYASSSDGEYFDERLPYPVFSLEGPNPHLDALRRAHAEKNHPGLVASGGSWGGTEDPRAVIIDDRLYLSFSAFHNWDSVRVGVTSLALSDLKAKRWNWSALSFLSPDKQVNKNWVLFPEKINNKFAILHSVSPTVEIDYRTDLSAVGKSEPAIESTQGPRTSGRAGHWDNWIRGAGTPPLKTDKGWLLFYHATDRENFSHEYQMGAMLLDLLNPQKILARASYPVLSPDAAYETNGLKPGVVYTCGATIHKDLLTVYYGAADNFVCAASASLSDFLRKLMHHERVTLTPSNI